MLRALWLASKDHPENVDWTREFWLRSYTFAKQIGVGLGLPSHASFGQRSAIATVEESKGYIEIEPTTNDFLRWLVDEFVQRAGPVVGEKAPASA